MFGCEVQVEVATSRALQLATATQGVSGFWHTAGCNAECMCSQTVHCELFSLHPQFPSSFCRVLTLLSVCAYAYNASLPRDSLDGHLILKPAYPLSSLSLHQGSFWRPNKRLPGHVPVTCSFSLTTKPKCLRSRHRLAAMAAYGHLLTKSMGPPGWPWHQIWQRGSIPASRRYEDQLAQFIAGTASATSSGGCRQRRSRC